MLKFIIPLYLFIAAVSGEGQPPDYSQNQLRFPLSPPQPPSEQRQALSPVMAMQLTSMPRAKPCQRRNFRGPVVISPDSGWVPLPMVQPKIDIEQRTGSQSVQHQFKPQSLTESKVSTNVNMESEEVDRNSEFPDKIVELVETRSISNRDSYENENRRAMSDPILQHDFIIESAKSNQNSVPQKLPKNDNPYHISDKVDSHEGSHECERNGEVGQNSRHDGESENDAVSKAIPHEVHEQAVKLITKCVDKEKNAQDDLQGDSRRSLRLNPSYKPNNSSDDVSLKAEVGNANEKASKANEYSRQSYPDPETLQPELHNPAKNARKWQSDSHVSLLENGRVCYACSTYFDPSCWHPNATTTVKYCNRDKNACVTKRFKVDGKPILIRDCDYTCNESDPYSMKPKAKSCSICHTDLCNSAHSVHGLTALLVAFIISAIKFTLQ